MTIFSSLLFNLILAHRNISPFFYRAPLSKNVKQLFFSTSKLCLIFNIGLIVKLHHHDNDVGPKVSLKALKIRRAQKYICFFSQVPHKSCCFIIIPLFYQQIWILKRPTISQFKSKTFVIVAPQVNHQITTRFIVKPPPKF